MAPLPKPVSRYCTCGAALPAGEDNARAPEWRRQALRRAHGRYPHPHTCAIGTVPCHQGRNDKQSSHPPTNQHTPGLLCPEIEFEQRQRREPFTKRQYDQCRTAHGGRIEADQPLVDGDPSSQADAKEPHARRQHENPKCPSPVSTKITPRGSNPRECAACD